MAPTTTHEEGEEASRSRCLARRRQRRRRAPALLPSLTVLRVPQPEAEPSWQQGKRKRSRAAKEQSRKRKRARAAEKNREEEDNAASRTEKRNTGDQEEEVAVSASGATEPACSSDASSAVSSPLRWPYRPPVERRRDSNPLDLAIGAAYMKLKLKYREKEARQLKLPTLDPLKRCFCLDDQNLLPVRDSARNTILQAAKAVLGLSSYMEGKLLKRSSGFLIDWDKESKACTVLTSAVIIRSKSFLDEWLGTDEYATDAEVRVHLLDKEDTTVAARLLHYDKHFNLALFTVDMDVPPQVTCFSSEVTCGQEVFVLGRDEGLYLKINHSRVQYVGPSLFQRHHYMFTGCGIDECGFGGPVIDFHGKVLGMASIPGMGFIPSSIILKCLDMWKKFQFQNLISDDLV